MPDAEAMLDQIAAARRTDPLAPVTVIAPSHLAALQLRRRLAERGPFAGVRFEPLPRISELLGAGRLAAEGRIPLARPIGDYLAEQVALETRGDLGAVRDLPGYARVLRQHFSRLRRGGIGRPDDAGDVTEGNLRETLRLYGLFREATARFYDPEDLLESAAEAVLDGRAGFLAEVGDVYLFPSVVRSAGAATLIDTLRRRLTCATVDDAVTSPAQGFVLAPDAASEAREAVREVLRALDGGVQLHEIAVFHGADPTYGDMLRECFEQSGVPATVLPGTPLAKTQAGRGILALLELPGKDFSRAATMDALGIAPLRHRIPIEAGVLARARGAAWDRVSRNAGITRGLDRWDAGLRRFVADREADLTGIDAKEEERRRRAIELQIEDGRTLIDVMRTLGARLEGLRAAQRADTFAASLTALVRDYFDPETEGFGGVLAEIDQLGTVAAVGGTFTLSSFTRALRANLDLAHTKARRLGDGVLVADYRIGDGLRFKRVLLCGAREGSLPAAPAQEALIEPEAWSRLRNTHPYIEDTQLRIERESLAASRAVHAATEALTWLAPLYEEAGTREQYPSHLMVTAARAIDPALRSGRELRARPAEAWLRRGASPLSLRLQGPPIDLAEARVRDAVLSRQHGIAVDASHRQWRAVTAWRARLGPGFSPWDGNLASLAQQTPIHVRRSVSPTSLEAYGACGFRYFCRSVLGLREIEEPEERELMDPAARGTLVHTALEVFFRAQRARGRPAPGESWTDADRDDLLKILDQKLADVGARGLRGFDVFADHERGMLRADLTEFLARDSAFRMATGAVPSEFEVQIPETEIAGVTLRGFADRIDRSPDGTRAWVIDYKTGSRESYKDIAADPLLGGTKLQLPAYLLAAQDAEEATAFYWFISQRGGFEQVEYARTPERDRLFERTVSTIVEGIAAGAFPAVPGDYDDFYGSFKNCGYCDFDRICARRRDDAFSEKAADPAMQPWLAVERTATEGQ